MVFQPSEVVSRILPAVRRKQLTLKLINYRNPASTFNASYLRNVDTNFEKILSQFSLIQFHQWNELLNYINMYCAWQVSLFMGLTFYCLYFQFTPNLRVYCDLIAVECRWINIEIIHHFNNAVTNAIVYCTTLLLLLLDDGVCDCVVKALFNLSEYLTVFG